MKILNTLTTLLLPALLFACSSDKYVSNDPNAGHNAPKCYDVDDLHQSYSMFYKPSHGWVGDPMPFYEDGVFHLFYLQDARDGKPTFHPWYKSTTKDFLSYVDDGEMIPCGTVDEQDGALGTGSVFKHDGVYYGFYTGHNGNLSPREKILLATSTDLDNWTKVTDFELEASEGYDKNEFRDPIIIKEGDDFKMLLTTRANYQGKWQAVIAQYTSTNLLDWTLEEPFYADDTTFLVECPDVFIEGDYQYIVYSDIADDDRMVHYTYRKVGSEEWIKPEKSNLDGSFYYAAKTASNGKDRFLFGWTPTRQDSDDYSVMSWAGSLVVHKLIQNSDGTLKSVIPESINEGISESQPLRSLVSKGAKLAGSTVNLDAAKEKAYCTFNRELGITKITATIDAKDSNRFGFELGACGNRSELYAIVFDLEEGKLNLESILLDSSESILNSVNLPLPADNVFEVTLLIENSVASIYVNNEIAFSNRIYKMNQNPWSLFADNGALVINKLEINK